MPVSGRHLYSNGGRRVDPPETDLFAGLANMTLHGYSIWMYLASLVTEKTRSLSNLFLRGSPIFLTIFFVPLISCEQRKGHRKVYVESSLVLRVDALWLAWCPAREQQRTAVAAILLIIVVA